MLGMAELGLLHPMAMCPSLSMRSNFYHGQTLPRQVLVGKQLRRDQRRGAIGCVGDSKRKQSQRLDLPNNVDDFLQELRELEEFSFPCLALNMLQCLPGTEMGNSIEAGVNLVYIPYMDYFWNILQQKLPDLHCLPLDPEIRVQHSRKGAKSARVFNWLLAGSRMRRIRLTYFEAGTAGQAFNALVYPEYRYDIPLLGIDLISLGLNKILCVIDFIPLSQEPEYLRKYTDQLVSSREKFADLCGQMTTRFYDENCFFSKQLIFYRSNLGIKDAVLEAPNGRLFQVYVDYIEEYFKTLSRAVEDQNVLQQSNTAAMHYAYNAYSSERDPAIKLFSTYFGEEWSHYYTEKFLFPSQTKIDE